MARVVVKIARNAGLVILFIVAAVLGIVEEDDALPSDARDILGQIGAFAFTAPSRPDQIEFHAVLTIEDGGPQ